jgi:hypothetical protein
MTAPRDPDRLIGAFLEDGIDELPDWAFDEVRHDIHRTRQRVVIGPWREPLMSNLTRYGVIAAAVVLLVGAGVVLLRPAPDGVAAPASVAPSASPSPSPTEAVAASPTLRPDAALPGPNRLGGGGVAPALILTVPEGDSGWSNYGSHLEKDYGRSVGPAVYVPGISRTYVDPCTDHTLKEPAPRGVQQLIAALGNQPGMSSKPTADVTISGYSGQYVDTTVTADITKCGGQDAFWLWSGGSGDDHWVAGATGETYRVYALDVDGTTFTFAVRIPANTTDAELAEVMAVLERLEIEPAAASASPKP